MIALSLSRICDRFQMMVSNLKTMKPDRRIRGSTIAFDVNAAANILYTCEGVLTSKALPKGGEDV